MRKIGFVTVLAVFVFSSLLHAEQADMSAQAGIYLSTSYPSPHGEYEEVETDHLTFKSHAFPESKGSEKEKVLMINNEGNFEWKDYPTVGLPPNNGLNNQALFLDSNGNAYWGFKPRGTISAILWRAAPNMPDTCNTGLMASTSRWARADRLSRLASV